MARPGIPDGLPAIAADRFAEGMAVPAIAAELAISERKVYRWIADAGGEALWAPRCMDAEELETWRVRAGGWAGADDGRSRPGAAGRARPTVWTLRPCVDCPLGHAAEMRALGRCNGTPAGVEVDEIEEETTMDQPAAGRAVERLRVDEATQTRVKVAVSAPCGTCAHAPVCGLRETLVALTGVVVRLPKLDEAIGIRLEASATCGHHLRRPNAHKQWTPEARAKQAERVLALNAARSARRAKGAESVA